MHPSGYFNQTLTVEYTIRGSLDGTTLVPDEFTSPANNNDPQQIFPIDIPGNAGLFDIDYVVKEFNRRGAIATRYIHTLWLVAPVAGAVGAEIQVVDAVNGTVRVQEIVSTLTGLTTFYRRSPPVRISQGSLLRIFGFDNPGLDTIKLRMLIEYIIDLNVAAASICCEEEPIPGPEGPVGPQGAQGPEGDQGDTGDSDVFDNLLNTVPSGVATGTRANLGINNGITGTTSQPQPTGTNLLTSTTRTRFASAVGAGLSISMRSGIVLWWRGNAAGLGGFDARFRFALTSFVVGHRAFIGFRAITAIIGNVNPSTLVNIIGIGFDAASSQWAIMHNDAAGAATVIPLGVAFDVDVNDLLELQLEAAANAGSVDYTVTNMSTGDVAAGTLAANLPANTVFLSTHVWSNTGADATTATTFDTVDIPIFTPTPSTP